MNSDNSQQGDGEAMAKLEQDLKGLEQQPITSQTAPVVASPEPSPPIIPSVVPAETASPVPENPKKSSPLMIIAIILAVLAILAAVAYIFAGKFLTVKPTPTPTPISTPIVVLTPFPTADPTANWKTYLDTKNGVEFKYPQSWDAEKLSGWTLNVFLDDHKFEIPLFTEFITPIEVNFNEFLNTETNVKSYFEKTIEGTALRLKTDIYGQDVTEKDNLTIGGRKAIQLEGTAGPGMLEGVYSKYILIQMDNRVLMVSLHNNKNFETIYNQILSTFKFIEATPAASPTP